MTPPHDQSVCREHLAAFSLYLEGEADADLCAAIETHLAGCTDCHTILATLDETIRLCRAQTPASLPAATRANLLAALGFPSTKN